MPNEDTNLNEQLAALRREIEALRRENELLRAERKEALDLVFGDLNDKASTEEGMAAELSSAGPLRPFLESLGVYPPSGTPK